MDCDSRRSGDVPGVSTCPPVRNGHLLSASFRQMGSYCHRAYISVCTERLRCAQEVRWRRRRQGHPPLRAFWFVQGPSSRRPTPRNDPAGSRACGQSAPSQASLLSVTYLVPRAMMPLKGKERIRGVSAPWGDSRASHKESPGRLPIAWLSGAHWPALCAPKMPARVAAVPAHKVTFWLH